MRPHHDAIVGITCHFGNVTYLWVPGSRDWNTVLELLRQSSIDDGKVDRFRRVAQNLQNRVLERMIEREI